MMCIARLKELGVEYNTLGAELLGWELDTIRLALDAGRLGWELGVGS